MQSKKQVMYNWLRHKHAGFRFTVAALATRFGLHRQTVGKYLRSWERRGLVAKDVATIGQRDPDTRHLKPQEWMVTPNGSLVRIIRLCDPQ